MNENAHLVSTFADAVGQWVDGAWIVWVGLAAALVIVVIITIFAKLRAKARRDRVPRYRRTGDA